MVSILVTFDSTEHLTEEYLGSLARGFVRVPGDYEVSIGDTCEAVLVHPESGESLELAAEVDLEVRDFFGEIVFDTVVPRDVNVTEAPSHGVSVLDYAPRSRGSRAYIELCMEVLERD